MAEPYKDEIRKAAKRYDVSPSLIKSVIAAGSCFDPAMVSTQGSMGLMQLMPDTARRFGALDVLDPASSIDAGTRYLSYLQKRYQGSIAEVVTAYSANEGWEWQHEAISTPFQAVHKPATRILSAWLRLENNKKANRQALLLMDKWGRSESAYRQALLALPATSTQTGNGKWLKARIAKVHYPRTLELRSCGGLSGKAMEAKAAPYQGIIKKAAKRYGVNPALIKSVIAAESCYREMVVSYKGASGLMQLMPATAEELGVFDIFDPEENINAGTRYLGYLLRMYKGSVTHAIAAYNAGAGRIEQDAPVTISFAETRGYIQKVLTHLTKLEKGKQAIQDARMLLADWGQAELEYQAALRGETLATVLPEQIPADGMLSPQPVLLGLDIAGLPGQEQPATTMDNTAQPLPVREMQSELVLASSTQQEIQPSVQLISAIDRGVVRVKRISTAVVTPVAAETVGTPPVLVTVPAEPVPAAGLLTEPAVLQSCEMLPPTIFTQAQQQGNGRYGAFFYSVQTGETLELVAAKLGINVLDIGSLNNLPLNALPRPGSRLKVAECARPL